jgi:histone deacetylase 11
MIKDSEIVRPVEANNDELMEVHTREYIDSLRWSATVAMITEVPPVAILPNFVVQSRLLSKFRKQTGGTILAARLAKERGWAINLGGGFHHCSAAQGGGFCAYADITLCIKFARQHLEGIKKVMIVDFDAHQGNGHETDFLNDDDVYILDMYNRWIYPGDRQAKRAIKCSIELDMHTEDNEYIAHIVDKLPSKLDQCKPDLVVYNAGTDILIGDQLGQLDITPDVSQSFRVSTVGRWTVSLQFECQIFGNVVSTVGRWTVSVQFECQIFGNVVSTVGRWTVSLQFECQIFGNVVSTVGRWTVSVQFECQIFGNVVSTVGRWTVSLQFECQISGNVVSTVGRWTVSVQFECQIFGNVVSTVGRWTVSLQFECQISGNVVSTVGRWTVSLQFECQISGNVVSTLDRQLVLSA